MQFKDNSRVLKKNELLLYRRMSHYRKVITVEELCETCVCESFNEKCCILCRILALNFCSRVFSVLSYHQFLQGSKYRILSILMFVKNIALHNSKTETLYTQKALGKNQ